MGVPKELEDKYLAPCGQPSLLESGRAAKWQHLSWSQHLHFFKPWHFRVILLPLQSGLTSSLLEWLQQKFQNGSGPSLPSRPVDFRSDPHLRFSADLSEGELFRTWPVISINIERKWDICSLCKHTKKGP